ncbi:TetR family transcriptional regulator [Tamlana nanhaiensis]|uniref:TetR family transcriptional regulator n=1 Tax=Neotamlana nanhaiensis TaxID=1382798 RepID=A0A0D7W5E5_9FLAO|nr:TetR/AcrR family transcriptional regulator [Tamlana nanhaiensis]KJD33923.1 TetR family transcriptional regulator [Tamlana nanhaiensis]
MISKEELLQCSMASFTAFGSKRFTMDELAQTLGISKKTIYKFYNSKEELVVESVVCLVNAFKEKINLILKDEQDPLSCIILIYKKGFESLMYFKPSFIFGLKKYYPEAFHVFEDFRQDIVFNTIQKLLQQAQEQNIIKTNVNMQLFCELYFNRFEEMAFKNDKLFSTYSQAELLNHFVIFNLKGISNSHYTNYFFS